MPLTFDISRSLQFSSKIALCISLVILSLTISTGFFSVRAADVEELEAVRDGNSVCWQCDLSNSDLILLNAPGGTFTASNFQNRKLIGAHLAAANLNETNFSGADMRGISLVRAFISGADLTGAKLGPAEDNQMSDLTGARLVKTNLTKADLTLASLRGTDLSEAKLADAILTYADLTDSRFEPTSIPPASGMRHIEGLDSLWYQNSPGGLSDLRNAFKNAGMRQEERQVTCSLMRSYRQNIGGLEGQLLYVLFEATTDWGMSPQRPIKLMLMLIPIFAGVYAVAIAVPSKRGGVWRIWEKDRVDKGTGRDEPERLLERGLGLPLYALGFSVLSAFHIGWRELNVGTWIARLSPFEYILRATGWARSVAGVQSLISVYLLALAVLTYFGRPFEW